MKGKVSKCDHREYGFAQLQIATSENTLVHSLFEDLGEEMQVRIRRIPNNSQYLSLFPQVWMSHGDQLSEMPENFHIIGHTKNAPYAAIAHNSKPFYGIQFHPEVTHSPRGREVIGRFVLNICGCKANWTMVSCSQHQISTTEF